MSTVDAKIDEFPVHFDELAPEGLIVVREATYRALLDAFELVKAEAAKFKQERDNNWNALQQAKTKQVAPEDHTQ